MVYSAGYLSKVVSNAFPFFIGSKEIFKDWEYSLYGVIVSSDVKSKIQQSHIWQWG